ncbi:Thiazole synthase [Fundidesulfovibrio magnetotacticus]|uniref:Thiazole synthase n=1 Tax=Fundidesulfovibrio magnetotacticus TaxID=2730080 RepID=A0A6V8LSA6_9BACT|nr:thiazole synthase [Fundidesulfovibrio magnetotacticus]GFK92676.1 Thiazole synthase [Fundidesulfovibrio magnetotacticus]
MADQLVIGGVALESRLFLGSGKYSSNAIIPAIVEASGAQVITVAVRRVDPGAGSENILSHIPRSCRLMPNTSGARNAQEAVRIARLARAAGCGDWIKIEVISDNRHLLPDNQETIEATRILAAEGFIVLPYMSPDLMAAKRMAEAGAAAVMPLGAPIGTNRGFRTRELVAIMIDELDVPVIVDAGIGKPSEACECMELGAAAVLANTAIATAADPVGMARAFAQAVAAGRAAWLAGPGAVSEQARASSPLTGFLHE